MAQRTLREVRIELQVRLGFGATDQPALAPTLNSFLSDAQAQLYKVGAYKSLQTYWDVSAPIGYANVAYPTSPVELNPEKIAQIMVNIGTSGAPNWVQLTEGIRPEDYNNVTQKYPERYERRSDGIELLPIRDKAYSLRVFGTRVLSPLREDDDTFDIDPVMCFAIALGAAKEHYRHPDAKTYISKAAGMLNSVKWDNTGPRLIRAGCSDEQPLPRPVVV